MGSSRQKLGAYVKFFDIDATQAWIGAVALGLLYSIGNNGVISILYGICSLFAISLVFFYLMGVNDYFDMDVDRKKGERSVLLRGEISLKEAAISLYLTAIIGLLLSLLVSYWFFFNLSAIFILSSLYSIPPVRYKRYYPYSTLGEISGAYFLFLTGYSIGAPPAWQALVVSTIPTALVTYKRLRHEVRHVEFDRTTGKNSMAVVHGPKVAKFVSQIILAIALVELFIFALIGLVSAIFIIFLTVFVIIFITIHVSRIHHHQQQSLIKKMFADVLQPLSLVWGFMIYFTVIIVSGLI